MPELFDNNSIEQWQAEGEVEITERAVKKARRLLDEYIEPTLDPGVDEALRDYIARRYVYDGENRLIAVEPTALPAPSAARIPVRLEVGLVEVGATLAARLAAGAAGELEVALTGEITIVDDTLYLSYADSAGTRMEMPHDTKIGATRLVSSSVPALVSRISTPASPKTYTGPLPCRLCLTSTTSAPA